MALVSRQPKGPRIVFGRTGVDSAFDVMLDDLRGRGYSTTARPSSLLAHAGSNAARTDELGGVDLAILILRDGESAPDALQEVVREAGVLQGRLGMDRAVLLVEDSVEGLSPDCGIAYIRFPPGRPEAVLDDVLARLRGTFPVVKRDLHERVSIPDQARSPDLRVTWALVAMVVIAALVPAVVALRARAADRFETAGASSPAGPTAGDDSSALPIGTCTLDLKRSSTLDDVIPCEGGGRLLVEGDLGPWRSGIAAIAVGDGVVGRLDYEPHQGSSGGPRTIDLAPGTSALDGRSLSTGVSAVVLRFHDDFQHVHLFRQSDLQGGVATLTYRVDR